MCDHVLKQIHQFLSTSVEAGLGTLPVLLKVVTSHQVLIDTNHNMCSTMAEAMITLADMSGNLMCCEYVDAMRVIG